MIFGIFSLFLYTSFPLLAKRGEIHTLEVFTDASVLVCLIACLRPGAETQRVGSERMQPIACGVTPRMETLTASSSQMKIKKRKSGQQFFKA